jgi:hypothetical protein
MHKSSRDTSTIDVCCCLMTALQLFMHQYLLRDASTTGVCCCLTIALQLFMHKSSRDTSTIDVCCCLMTALQLFMHQYLLRRLAPPNKFGDARGALLAPASCGNPRTTTSEAMNTDTAAGPRHASVNVAHRLVTVHPNPGPGTRPLATRTASQGTRVCRPILLALRAWLLIAIALIAAVFPKDLAISAADHWVMMGIATPPITNHGEGASNNSGAAARALDAHIASALLSSEAAPSTSPHPFSEATLIGLALTLVLRRPRRCRRRPFIGRHDAWRKTRPRAARPRSGTADDSRAGRHDADGNRAGHESGRGDDSQPEQPRRASVPAATLQDFQRRKVQRMQRVHQRRGRRRRGLRGTPLDSDASAPCNEATTPTCRGNKTPSKQLKVQLGSGGTFNFDVTPTTMADDLRSVVVARTGPAAVTLLYQGRVLLDDSPLWQQDVGKAGVVRADNVDHARQIYIVMPNGGRRSRLVDSDSTPHHVFDSLKLHPSTRLSMSGKAIDGDAPLLASLPPPPATPVLTALDRLRGAGGGSEEQSASETRGADDPDDPMGGGTGAPSAPAAAADRRRERTAGVGDEPLTQAPRGQPPPPSQPVPSPVDAAAEHALRLRRRWISSSALQRLICCFASEGGGVGSLRSDATTAGRETPLRVPPISPQHRTDDPLINSILSARNELARGVPRMAAALALLIGDALFNSQGHDSTVLLTNHCLRALVHRFTSRTLQPCPPCSPQARQRVEAAMARLPNESACIFGESNEYGDAARRILGSAEPDVDDGIGGHTTDDGHEQTRERRAGTGALTCLELWFEDAVEYTHYVREAIRHGDYLDEVSHSTLHALLSEPRNLFREATRQATALTRAERLEHEAPPEELSPRTLGHLYQLPPDPPETHSRLSVQLSGGAAIDVYVTDTTSVADLRAAVTARVGPAPVALTHDGNPLRDDVPVRRQDIWNGAAVVATHSSRTRQVYVRMPDNSLRSRVVDADTTPRSVCDSLRAPPATRLVMGGTSLDGDAPLFARLESEPGTPVLNVLGRVRGGGGSEKQAAAAATDAGGSGGANQGARGPQRVAGEKKPARGGYYRYPCPDHPRCLIVRNGGCSAEGCGRAWSDADHAAHQAAQAVRTKEKKRLRRQRAKLAKPAHRTEAKDERRRDDSSHSGSSDDKQTKPARRSEADLGQSTRRKTGNAAIGAKKGRSDSHVDASRRPPVASAHGSAEGGKADASNSWRCTSCTSYNGLDRDACDLCETERPATWECPLCSHRSPDTLHICDFCSHPRARPKTDPNSSTPTPSTASGETHKAPETWACAKCTYANEVNTTVCAMCSSLRALPNGWVCRKCTCPNDADLAKCGTCESDREEKPRPQIEREEVENYRNEGVQLEADMFQKCLEAMKVPEALRLLHIDVMWPAASMIHTYQYVQKTVTVVQRGRPPETRPNPAYMQPPRAPDVPIPQNTWMFVQQAAAGSQAASLPGETRDEEGHTMVAAYLNMDGFRTTFEAYDPLNPHLDPNVPVAKELTVMALLAGDVPMTAAGGERQGRGECMMMCIRRTVDFAYTFPAARAVLHPSAKDAARSRGDLVDFILAEVLPLPAVGDTSRAEETADDGATPGQPSAEQNPRTVTATSATRDAGAATAVTVDAPGRATVAAAALKATTAVAEAAGESNATGCNAGAAAEAAAEGPAATITGEAAAAEALGRAAVATATARAAATEAGAAAAAARAAGAVAAAAAGEAATRAAEGGTVAQLWEPVYHVVDQDQFVDELSMICSGAMDTAAATPPATDGELWALCEQAMAELFQASSRGQPLGHAAGLLQAITARRQQYPAASGADLFGRGLPHMLKIAAVRYAARRQRELQHAQGTPQPPVEPAPRAPPPPPAAREDPDAAPQRLPTHECQPQAALAPAPPKTMAPADEQPTTPTGQFVRQNVAVPSPGAAAAACAADLVGLPDDGTDTDGDDTDGAPGSIDGSGGSDGDDTDDAPSSSDDGTTGSDGDVSAGGAATAGDDASHAAELSRPSQSTGASSLPTLSNLGLDSRDSDAAPVPRPPARPRAAPPAPAAATGLKKTKAAQAPKGKRPACSCNRAVTSPGKQGRHPKHCAITIFNDRQNHEKRLRRVHAVSAGMRDPTADAQPSMPHAADRAMDLQRQAVQADVSRPMLPGGDAPLLGVPLPGAAGGPEGAEAGTPPTADVPAGFAYDDVAQLHLPTMKSIPGGRKVQQLVSDAYVKAVAMATTAATETLGCLLLYALPKILLGAPHRQGSARPEESNATIVQQRCTAFLRSSTGYVDLWQAAKHAAAARVSRQKPQATAAAPADAEATPAVTTYTSQPAGPTRGRPSAGGARPALNTAGLLDHDDDGGASVTASEASEPAAAFDTFQAASTSAASAAYGTLEPPRGLWEGHDLTQRAPVALQQIVGAGPTRIAPNAAKRAHELATDGQFSRAAAATKGAKIAPKNEETLTRLRNKHPTADPPTLPAVIPATSLQITPNRVKQAVMAMDAHSAPGPSGQRAIPLQQMLRTPGSRLADALAPLFQRVVEGKLPREACEALYSALLVAFLKDPLKPDVRPIACGEFWRRCIGRQLLRHVRKQAAAHLSEFRQVAVGVSAGAEALAHATRRVVASWMAAPQDHLHDVIVCTDIMNAFNMALREEMLAEVCEYLPDLAQYVAAGYGQPTKLYYGAHVIASEQGAQQGCPLGTLLFALCMHRALRELRRLHPGLVDRLTMQGFFADDGTHAGNVRDVAEFLRAFIPIAAKYGIRFQPAKFAVFCHLAVEDHVKMLMRAACAAEIPDTSFRRWEQTTLMGAAVGGRAPASAHVHKIADLAKTAFHRLGQMPAVHQKVATLLFCGKGLATYACRTSNPDVAAVRRIDDDLVKALCDALGVPTDSHTCARVRLPLSHGGMGARMMSDYAQIAFIAAWSESFALQHRLAPGLPLDADDGTIRATVRELVDAHSDNNPTDAFIAVAHVRDHVEELFTKARDAAAALAQGRPDDAHQVLAVRPPQASAAGPETEAEAAAGPAAGRAARRGDEPRRRLQKKWSKALDDALMPTRRRLAGGDHERTRALLNSCSASHQGIAPIVDVTRIGESNPWMKDAECTAYMRLRLGAPIFPSDGQCAACGSPSDRYGHHALACMRSGKKQALHNAAMSQITGLATVALMAPRREIRIFTNNDKRVDAVLAGLRVDAEDYPRSSLRPNRPPPPPPPPQPGGALRRVVAIDYTCPSPFTDGSVSAAAACVAGAALLAAAGKDDKYAADLDASAQNYWIVPWAVDSLGAMEPRAVKLLGEIALGLAKRNGSTKNAENTWLRRTLQCNHQRLVGTLLVSCQPTTAVDDERVDVDGAAAIAAAPVVATDIEVVADDDVAGAADAAAVGAHGDAGAAQAPSAGADAGETAGADTPAASCGGGGGVGPRWGGHASNNGGAAGDGGPLIATSVAETLPVGDDADLGDDYGPPSAGTNNHGPDGPDGTGTASPLAGAAAAGARPVAVL